MMLPLTKPSVQAYALAALGFRVELGPACTRPTREFVVPDIAAQSGGCLP